MNVADTALDPEQNATHTELVQLLDEAVLALPDAYRAVVMMRDVEEMDTAETAAALNLTEQNVKVRLHRGHAMMRGWLFSRVGVKTREAFPFMGERCDRVVRIVLERIARIEAQLS